MVLLAFPPENLIFYGDYRHFFNLADLVRWGYYPFVDYWFEYPPLMAYLNLAIYLLAGQQFKNYILLMAGILIMIDSGNLYLLYRLTDRLYNRSAARQNSWLYTALWLPLIILLGNFDALSLFFILLALHSLFQNRPGRVALALGIGAMTKVMPLLLLPTIGRLRGLKAAVGYGLSAALIGLLVVGPFALTNPAMTWASFQSQLNKSSFQTVWALIDGNDSTGSFGPHADRLDPAKASQPLHNPSRLPPWLTLLPFAGLGLFIYTRPRQREAERDAVIFAGLTLLIFFLWSKGWSPQWQVYLIPLLLLTLQPSRAVLFIIVLGFVNLLEWPVLLSRGLNQFLPLTIILRTFILAILTVELYRRLTGHD